MQVMKQQLELDMKQQTGSKSGNEYGKGYILSPCLFNLYAECIMRNSGLDEAQAGIKIAWRVYYPKIAWRVYYPKQFIDSTQSLSSYQQYSSQS